MALLALVAVGCDPGPSDPAAIAVSGRVAGGDGNGIGGVRVSARPDGELQGASARLTALGELGLACVDERRPPECTGEARSTGSDGAFTVPVEGSAAPPGVVAGPVTVELAVRAGAESGQLTGAAAATVVAVTGDEDVGDLVLWEPSLEFAPGDGGDGVLTWSAHPSGDVEYRALAESSDGRLLWDETSSDLEVVFPADALRDSAGGLSVVARARTAGLVWRSPRVPFVADETGVHLAGVDDVGWPLNHRISETVVLVAIIALLLTSAMLVMVAGSRHRRRLRLVGALPLARWARR